MDKKQVLQKKFDTGFLAKKTGVVCTLKECYNKKAEDLKIEGNSVQDAKPTLDLITLPSGYSIVDYITVDRANTLLEHVATLDTSMEMDVEFSAEAFASTGFLWCCRSGGGVDSFNIYVVNGDLCFDYGNIRRYAQYHLSADTRYNIKAVKNKMYVNNNLTTTVNNVTITNTTDIVLFSSYIPSNGQLAGYDNFLKNTKIYSVKCWEEDTLVADYVPCLNSNNVAGFYDLVTGNFYTKNIGAGSFTNGKLLKTNVSIDSVGTKLISDTYKQLNYVTANNAIVPLNHIATADTEIEIDIELTNKIDTQCLFCCRTSLDSDSITCFIIGERIRFDYGNKKYSSIFVNTNTRYKITFKNKKLYINNVLQTTVTDENINNTKIFNLFSSYNPYGTNSNFCKNVKCYNMKCWESGTLIANYVPCLNSNNAAGFYDLVTENFYTASNTNSLTASDLSTKELASITVNKLYKNLCNFDSKEAVSPNGTIKLYNNCYIKYNNYFNWDTSTSNAFYLEENKTYTLSATYISGSSNGGTGGYISVINVSNSNYKFKDAIIIRSNSTANYSNIFVCQKTGWYKLYFWHGVENSVDLIYKIQVEENNIATQAEDPNTNTQVVYIEDTLKKIDNIKDCLSFKNKSILRKIKKAYIDTNTPATAELSNNSEELIISIDVLTAFGVAVKANTHCLCNMLDTTKIIVDTTINMYFPSSVAGSTLTEFRSWLTDKKLYITYVRDTEEVEEIEEIEEIKLKKGINTIFVDSNVPAQITTKYRSKRKEVL